MKKVFPLLLIVIVGCTKTKQQKAEKLVSLYLDSSLNDPKSYQSVKFTKLDTLKASPLVDPKYKALSDKFDSLLDASDVISKAIPYTYSVPKLMYYKKESNRLYLEESANLKQQSAFVKGFKKKQIGWGLIHTYRAKNGVGALTIGTTAFYFDKDLTKVDSSKNLK